MIKLILCKSTIRIRISLMEGMPMFPTWLVIITLPLCVNSQVKWKHICYGDTKEVSCPMGSILEVVHIYQVYREAGCTNNLTGSVDDVASCSQISGTESNQLNDINRRCNMTNTCNITAFLDFPMFVCPWLGFQRNNIIKSYSYKCNPGPVAISSTPDQPSTRAEEGGVNTTDITTCSSVCPSPKPDNDQYTVKWEHICPGDTKELSCPLGSILEVVHIYQVYREAGCTNNLTGPVDDVADCSQISYLEPFLLNDFNRRCNMTNACNIRIWGSSSLPGCPRFSNTNNMESYSYRCNPGPVVISSTPVQPIRRAEEGGINTTDITTCSSECLSPKPDNDQYTASVVAGATVGGLVAGLVIGIIGTVMLIAYKRKEPGNIRCLKLQPEAEVINQTRPSAKGAPGESSATEYHNMNQSEPTLHSVKVTSQDSNDGESSYDVINQQEQGIREYDSLQQNDYINRPDDNQYEAIRTISTRTN